MKRLFFPLLALSVFAFSGCATLLDLNDSELQEKIHKLQGLDAAAKTKLMTQMTDHLKDPDPLHINNAALVLGSLGKVSVPAVPALIAELDGQCHTCRYSVVVQLGETDPGNTCARMLAARCYSAVHALEEIGPAAKDAAPVLVTILSDISNSILEYRGTGYQYTVQDEAFYKDAAHTIEVILIALSRIGEVPEAVHPLLVALERNQAMHKILGEMLERINTSASREALSQYQLFEQKQRHEEVLRQIAAAKLKYTVRIHWVGGTPIETCDSPAAATGQCACPPGMRSPTTMESRYWGGIEGKDDLWVHQCEE